MLPVFFIRFSNMTNIEKFNLWLHHYHKLSIVHSILILDESCYSDNRDNDNSSLFQCWKDWGGKVIVIDNDDKNKNKKNDINDKSDIDENFLSSLIELTENDFLVAYTANSDTDDSLTLTTDDFMNKFNCYKQSNLPIGKVFHVPVPGKPKYTTFEIPDFILYRHLDHSNYQHLRQNLREQKEQEQKELYIVWFSLETSKKANKQFYYENDFITSNTSVTIADTNTIKKGTNVYDTFAMNVLVNKEKKYGIIWNSKCGCSTISTIFCHINNASIDKGLDKRSLNFYNHKYRFNPYLENINYIMFVRNPYTRFLSCFVDKHVYKIDPIYITLPGYFEYMHKYQQDSLGNLCHYLLNGGYISEHFKLISENTFIKMIMNNSVYTHSNVTVCKMEYGFNNVLYTFLEKYHTFENDEKSFILSCHENINKNGGDLIQLKKKVGFSTFETLEPFDFFSQNTQNIKEHLSYSKLNYDLMLKHTKIKNIIYFLFLNDFVTFNYNY